METKEDAITLSYQNFNMLKGMNRKNRRVAEKLIRKGYDDDQLAQEFNKIIRKAYRPSRLINLWLRILRGKDTYHTHIPKGERPRIDIGVAKIDQDGTRHNLMVTDYAKCQKLRHKLAK
ncbi:MAG: hypothetical protein WC251_03310 [Candidatus Izemoplasmatales bacterium]|jgi:hypothetical protein